jgi:hypothetical protein
MQRRSANLKPRVRDMRNTDKGSIMRRGKLGDGKLGRVYRGGKAGDERVLRDMREADKDGNMCKRDMDNNGLGFMRRDSETEHNANMRRRERDAERDNELQQRYIDMERGGMGDMHM